MHGPARPTVGVLVFCDLVGAGRRAPLGVMIQVTESVQSREKMLAMNEALVLGSLRQHELAEASQLLNAQLKREINERKQVEAALRESEARYRSLFNSIDEGFCVIEKVEGGVGEAVDFRYLEANPAFATQSGMSDMVGKTIRQVLPDEPEGWCFLYDTALSTGKPIRFERELVSHGRTLELYAFRVEDETHRRVAVIFKDITERNRAESVLRESEERFHALFELGPVAVYYCDASGVIRNFNRRAAELWGREPALGDTDERFCGSFKLFRPDGSFMPHEQSPMAEVISGKISEARDAEALIERPDGSGVSVVVNIRPLKNERGEITGAINCFYDITERKEAEQRQHFLMNELAHRSKNLLAVIASIASRSLSGTRSLSEAREVLIHRIQALARSQSALVTGGFEGASVAEIIHLEFEGFSDQVKAVGPDVLLNSRVAQTFALVVHELATNATKYGALSLPNGQVAIHWLVEGTGAEARFKFQWQERNGPPVVPPTRQGFGHMVIEKAAAQDFGPPKIRFASEGLSYEIDALLSAVAAAGEQFLEGNTGTTKIDNALKVVS
jgi:PAS domain S-box-containing protein